VAIKRGQIKLLLILGLFVAPFALADLAFRYWKPDSFSNYGELVQATEFRPAGLQGADGGPFDLAGLRGKWVFLLVQAGECDAACRQNLYLMRQVRQAMGREQDRIARLVIAERPLPAELTAEHAGLKQARARELHGLSAQLPAGEAFGQIYLVDPLGRLVLRYPQAADGSRMLKDVQRLLKYSQIG
jgi:cytochrome oxidase Cu insertion factor (SCO1/SenC/PrrC family)